MILHEIHHRRLRRVSQINSEISATTLSMHRATGTFMQTVFEFKAIFHTVLVYPNMIVLRPGKFKQLGGPKEDKKIRFADISDVFLKEAGILMNGFMHFSIRGEADQSAPSLMQAGNDENTFCFGYGKNAEAIQIRKYILDQMANPKTDVDTEETMSERQPKSARFSTPCDSADFDQYRKLTAERDWSGIFRFNSLTKDVVGVGKELNVLYQHLQDNEVVFALVAGLMSQTTTSNPVDGGFNTWLGVLTDRRVLLLDHAMLSDSVDTQSIRYDRIQAVSSSQGWVFGKVVIDIGNRSVTIDNCDKEHVKAFSRIANDWLEHLAVADEAKSTNLQGNPVSDRDPIEEIKRLAELKASGILSEEEFASAKKSLLSKM